MSGDESVDRPMGDDDTVRSVFEQAPGLLLALDGPRLEFSAANAAYRAVYPKFALGVSVWDTSPEMVDQQLYEMFARVYETGEPVDAKELRVQIDVGDGNGVQEMFFDMMISPRRGPDGVLLGVLIVGQDATERVRTRRAIEERARKYQTRYETVRESAIEMQTALLSQVVPVLPNVDVAAAYLVAAEDTAAGGDWFDVVTGKTGDDVCLVVGDVVGHGVQAAAVMAQLRAAVRMQLHAGAGIAEALTAVDHFAGIVAGAPGATLCLVRLDPNTGDIEYCTAGHPPPLIVTGDGSASYLPPTGARPLGSNHEFHTATARLDLDDAVMLYSDGIIERPGRQFASSTAEIAEVAVRVLHPTVGFPLDPEQAPVERLCSHALELLIRGTNYNDDITLLAAQRRPAPPAFHTDVPADEDAERTVRANLREWFSVLGNDFVSGQILEHAVTEYVANASEHAYVSSAAGRVVVDGTLGSDGHVRVTVCDSGTWRDPIRSDQSRGRGLPLAQAMVPDVTIDRSDAGTTVSASHKLTRSAHIVTDLQSTQSLPAVPTTTFDVTMEGDSLVVTGDVDNRAAPTLEGALAANSRAGTMPLTVDLDAVTHLGSAGVNVLAKFCRRSDRQDTACELLAPPGSTAHHVLSLVGLPIAAPQDDLFDDR